MDVKLSIVSCPTVVTIGREFFVQVAVENCGTEFLTSKGPNPLHLSYRWSGFGDDREPLRTTFWQPVPPATTKLFDIRVAAPLTDAGSLIMTLVREHVRWYDSGEDAVVATTCVARVAQGEHIPLDIQRYERRLRSQNGEDGILAELLRRVGWRQRFIVEFGVSDGFECNSATLIEDDGWSGFLIEGDTVMYGNLCRRFDEHSNVNMRNARITRENIGDLFREAEVPHEFDILSIDIDGNDYWIWQALKDYRPRIVVIEYNPFYVPPRRWVMQYDAAHHWRSDTHYGASLTSLATLGTQMGYSLVGTDSRGVNAFFVRSDLALLAHLPARDPADVFTSAAVEHPFAGGLYEEV